MTLNERLAEFFRARAGQWIDGDALGKVAGRYGWRSRVSNLRRPPFTMTIENRQRRVKRFGGSGWVVSEYRYQPQPDLLSVVDNK